MSTELAKTNNQSLAQVGVAGIQIRNFEELLKFAEYVHKSPFCPKGFNDAGSVLVAVQCAMELGMQPMAGLQNIAVINGRPGIYGDAALALVRASGLLEVYREEVVGSGEDMGIKITVKRRGFDEASETFTVKNAKTAGLWGKAGPWTQYPKRMLMFRARGFLLRDQFGDVLKGFKTTEELGDMPEDERVSRAKKVEGVRFELEENPLEALEQPKQAATVATSEAKEGELV